MLNTQVAVSILNSDLANLGAVAERIDKSGAGWLHFDVMDGVFVENITFGSAVLKAIKPHSKAFMDVHLMVTHPEKQIKLFAEAGADSITFHIETKCNPHKVIKMIHDCGIRAGVAIKPATPVSVLERYMRDADMALVMSVEPGSGGQAFIPSTVDKIREMRRIAPKIDIEVDGGIKPDTAKLVREAGANILVAGTFMLHAPDMKAAAAALLEG